MGEFGKVTKGTVRHINQIYESDYKKEPQLLPMAIPRRWVCFSAAIEGAHGVAPMAGCPPAPRLGPGRHSGARQCEPSGVTQERTLPALEAAHIRPRANHDDGLIANAARCSSR
jgi:hypothetical protein